MDETHPAGPAGFAALLRRIAGVDEALLAQAPTDRFRYSRLGGVIVGTAAIAAFSMWLGLGEILGGSQLLLIVPALMWGLFIGNLDAWIVSSLHGTRWRSHMWVILPRLALAVIFGFLIAEPMVLRAFQTAIVHEIKDTRQNELLAFQTKLRVCNPANGDTPSAKTGCAQSLIVVNRPSPAALATQLNGLTHQEKALRRTIDGTTASELKLQRTARDECNGTRGAGLSGKFGDGVNCESDREAVKQFVKTHSTGQSSAQLVAVRGKIGRVNEQLKTSSQEYERAVKAAIAAKVAERRSHQGPIGLLERLYALKRLVATNWYLAVAEWFLRLLFVTIDCLPVITKVTGGSTSYDQLLELSLVRNERSFEARQRAEEKKKTSVAEFEQYEAERRLQEKKEALDSELRLAAAKRNLDVEDAINEFTERLMKRRQPVSPQFH